MVHSAIVEDRDQLSLDTSFRPSDDLQVQHTLKSEVLSGELRACWEEHLKDAVTPFSERELSSERREELQKELDTKLPKEEEKLFAEVQKELNKPLAEITSEEFKQFLIKRYQVTNEAQSTEMQDVIRGIREEGFISRVEDKVLEHKKDLQDGNEDHKGFEKLVDTTAAELKEKAKETDLSQEKEYLEMTKDLMVWDKRLSDKFGEEIDRT